MSPNAEAVEAELAVIGSLMQWPDLREYVGALSPTQFYDPALGRLYAEVTRRLDAGEVADAVTLRPWFLSDPASKEVPRLLMTALAECTAMPPYVAAYADTIRAAHTRREAIRLYTDALEQLKAGADVLGILASSEAQLRALDGGNVSSGAEIAEASDSLLASIDVAALSSGFPSLDEKMGGLHRSDLIIVAGRPSMGKTAFAAQLARNAAYMGKAVHFASLEMSKEQLACRCLSERSYWREYGSQRVQYYHIRNGSNVDRELLRSLRDELPRGLIIDDRAAQTLAQLEQSARATRRRLKRLDLIVVDYLQLMKAQRSDGRVNEVSEISQGLKAIAKRLNVPVVALSQLSRGVEGRENKRPTLSDLRDSGAIEQDADVVIGCYREAYYLERDEPPADEHDRWVKWRKAMDAAAHDFEAIILKQRAGPIGTVKLTAHLEFDLIRDRSAA